MTVHFIVGQIHDPRTICNATNKLNEMLLAIVTDCEHNVSIRTKTNVTDNYMLDFNTVTQHCNEQIILNEQWPSEHR